MTEEKIFTLSKGTKEILARLDTPVTVRFYASEHGTSVPVFLKSYASRVEDLLKEYQRESGGLVELEKYDPEPDSDAEDSANLDGVEGQAISLGGDPVYLGMSFTCVDQKAALPFLSPDRERLLEYDISRSISEVTATRKPLVGVMSGFKVFGSPAMPPQFGAQMGQQEPWVFLEELKRKFEVREIDQDVKEIDPEVDLLLVVHPNSMTESTEFAIDQFVLRGGKLVALLDPFSIASTLEQPSPTGMPMSNPGASSTFEKLLPAWGLSLDTQKIAADLNFRTPLSRGMGPAEEMPAVLTLNELGVNKDDVSTGSIDNLVLPFPGAFVGEPAAGLEKTVLLHTSEQSQMVESYRAQMGADDIVKKFMPSGVEYALALRLSGTFKTAFPNGNPAKEEPSDSDKKEKTDKTPENTTQNAEALKESKSKTSVVLIADADLLYDQFTVQKQQIFGQTLVIPRNANIDLLLNLVEQLSGDSNLIEVRSRGTLQRPFTLIKSIQAEAEDRYRAKINQLEDELSRTNQRLSDLQQNKEQGQRFIISPEQQAELEKFRTKKVEVRNELKTLRRQLRRDIDSLENRLKWSNIVGMPIAVIGAGIGIALFKRKRAAAK